MTVQEVSEKAIKAIPNHILGWWGKAMFSIPLDYRQNCAITIFNRELNRDDWAEIKQCFKTVLGAKFFRRVGNTLCFYVDGLDKGE